MGKCLVPFESRFSFALDFDGWNAVAVWFGCGRPGNTDSDDEIWNNVLETSKETRIEWHQNKGRIHVIYYSNRPVTKKKILIKEAAFEVRYDELLIASPSIHGDGNAWTPLGTKEIATLDEVELLKLEAKIDSICEGYMSDTSKSAFLAWLENPENWKSLGVDQGRHNALVILGTSYYYRYSNEWHNLTDDQRRERLWEKNMQFGTPKSEDEFNSIWKWIIDKHRKRRDQQREEWEDQHAKHSNETDPLGMPGCIYYEIRPGKYISGTPDNKVVEIEVKLPKDDSDLLVGGPERVQLESLKLIKKTFTACKPVKIIKHRNPVSFLETGQKYTVVFKGSEPSGNFTLKQKSLSEIVARLKETDALCDKNIDNALIAQIKGFEQRGLLEVNDDLDYIGFFLDSNDKIIASGIEVKNEISRADVLGALNFIEESKRYYDGRLDLLATSIKWDMITPSLIHTKV